MGNTVVCCEQNAGADKLDTVVSSTAAEGSVRVETTATATPSLELIREEGSVSIVTQDGFATAAKPEPLPEPLRWTVDIQKPPRGLGLEINSKRARYDYVFIAVFFYYIRGMVGGFSQREILQEDQRKCSSCPFERNREYPEKDIQKLHITLFKQILKARVVSSLRETPDIALSQRTLQRNPETCKNS